MIATETTQDKYSKVAALYMMPALVVGVGCFLAMSFIPTSNIVMDTFVAVVVASLLVLISQGGLILAKRLFSSPILSGVGRWSYSLYLVHYPVLFCAVAIFNRFYAMSPLRSIILLACTIAASLVLSYGFYLIFERPFTLKPALTKCIVVEPRGNGLENTSLGEHK